MVPGTITMATIHLCSVRARHHVTAHLSSDSPGGEVIMPIGLTNIPHLWEGKSLAQDNMSKLTGGQPDSQGLRIPWHRLLPQEGGTKG